MSQFIETIQIANGKICLPDYHNERFNATRSLFFCIDTPRDLQSLIRVPEHFLKGKVKCRVLYDAEIQSVDFSFYQARQIKTLKLVNAPITYDYKFANRDSLTHLLAQASPADEVLIVNNGMLSDTSFSNIIFRQNGRWFTPDTPLLEGVQRAFLLDEGIIEERQIKPANLMTYDAFMLINAMLTFDEQRALPITNIIQ